ncbi:MAG: serine protein kinase PrkA [Myxococcota bacterium]
MERWIEESKDEFKQHRMILSFDDYLAELKKYPRRHLRNAAQYFLDVIDHFGSYEVYPSTGALKRYKVFDAEFNQHEGQVLGQETVQDELVRLIRNFVRAGRIDRLILLHGPNGSAKTSLIQALTRGAEYFSHQDDGALYRFNWVFPPKTTVQGGIGFFSAGGSESSSYAYLDSTQMESKILCEYKDHPILLLPLELRSKLFEELELTSNVADIFRKGDLSSKNKKVFDALLASYQGDYKQVYKHIQVERFYLSKRYRKGIGTVEPQMAVDAYSRQITADQSMGQLPASLQHITLYESAGPLSDGNRGLIEYNDLLKRPIESWKYLLAATEQAQASLDTMSLALDTLMIASSNELHLNGFREYPDWQSFKGRFELIRVPYLLRYSDELKIYQSQIPKALHGIHIAPHALELIARWAILTRLESPKMGQLAGIQEEIVKSLTPLEKLELYDSGIPSERFTQRESKELKQLIPTLFHQYADDLEYEGRYGASPREIRMILLNSAQAPNYDHLSPIAVIDELREFVREKTSYEFLRREPVGEYRNPVQFVELVREQYLKQLDEEIKNSLGLVEAGSHFEMFERYVRHVSAWTKKEKMLSPITGKLADPDAELMNQVESVLLARGESAEEFRQSMITRIGSFRLEHPDQPVDYHTLFSNHLRRLKEDYYGKQSKTVNHILTCYLKMEEGDTKGISAKDIEQAQVLKNNLLALGYTESSARQAVAYSFNNSHPLSPRA